MSIISFVQQFDTPPHLDGVFSPRDVLLGGDGPPTVVGAGFSDHGGGEGNWPASQGGGKMRLWPGALFVARETKIGEVIYGFLVLGPLDSGSKGELLVVGGETAVSTLALIREIGLFGYTKKDVGGAGVLGSLTIVGNLLTFAPHFRANSPLTDHDS